MFLKQKDWYQLYRNLLGKKFKHFSLVIQCLHKDVNCTVEILLMLLIEVGVGYTKKATLKRPFSYCTSQLLERACFKPSQHPQPGPCSAVLPPRWAQFCLSERSCVAQLPVMATSSWLGSNTLSFAVLEPTGGPRSVAVLTWL